MNFPFYLNYYLMTISIRRFLTSLLPLFVASLVVWAQPRSESEAMKIAADFLQHETSSAPRHLKAVPLQRVSRQIRCQLLRPSGGFALQTGFYVFNDEAGHGFVIVGADSRQRDILGYALEGTFDADDLPCGLVALLEQYNQEYSIAQSIPPSLFPTSRVEAALCPVTPLLKSEWGQNKPYNNYCPNDPATNQRCITGCVATAMAQIMYYYRYPNSIADSVVNYISQYDETRKITLNKRLSSYPLNWSDMLDIYKNVNYTAAQGNAVANLMSAAGLSVHMSYSSVASSSHTFYVPYALIYYFGYNPNMKYYRKNYFTEEAWLKLIEDELNAGRPIIYGGFGEQNEEGKRPGHTFTLDGCDASGRCHFNWGWEGSYQRSGSAYTYFALSSLKPGSHNYTNNQEMVVGIDKKSIGLRELVAFSEGFDIENWQQGFRVGDVALFSLSSTWCFDSHANFHTSVPCYITFGIKQSDGRLTPLNGITDANHRNWKSTFGQTLYKEQVTFDASRFQEGTNYYLYPALIDDTKSHWYPIRTLGTESDFYVARVKNGRVYIGKRKEPAIPGDDPAINYISVTCDNSNLSRVQPGSRLVLHAVFKNSGSSVTTETRVRIFDADIQGVYATDGKSYTFSSGAQTSVDMTIKLPDDIADGTYYATIQYKRTWGDEPGWRYNKDYLIQFTVNTGSDTPKEMTVKTSSAGYATFFDSQSSYVLPAGLIAYVVSAAANGSLTYNTIADGASSGIVPKGVAVMLKGSKSQTYKLVATNSTATYSGSNLLRGSDTSTTTTAPASSGYLFYKLSYGQSGSAYSDVFGWYWGSSGGGAFTIDGHKAWLALKESSTRAAFLPLPDDFDGIEESTSSNRTSDGYIYDLSGRKVHRTSEHRTLPHGIYVVNGKKVSVK